MKISGEFLRVAEAVMLYAIERFKDEPNWQGKTGAYVCIASASTGMLYEPAPVGVVPPEKADKYREVSQEKVTRLLANVSLLSSWATRDPDKKKWGGAIALLALRSIFSMSGLPELGDEAVMLATALYFYPDVLEDLEDIAKISGNPYWPPLRDAVLEGLIAF